MVNDKYSRHVFVGNSRHNQKGTVVRDTIRMLKSSNENSDNFSLSHFHENGASRKI